jgi:DNA-cytosine methyltransferase
VDTTQTTHISLCAGYGGIDIGLKRAVPGLQTIAFSEIEAFACANLVAKMEAGLLDAAPIWTDLKTFPWGQFCDRVDILSGGYPCQPFSAAGKRLGTEDPRHLWPYIANGIRAMRPRICFFENVEGHITLGLREVVAELESMGYAVSWGIFSAVEVGAPHQRKRVFILAHCLRERRQLQDWWKQSAIPLFIGNGPSRGIEWPTRPGQPQHQWEPPRVVEHANCDGCKRDVVGNAAQQDCNRKDNRISGEADSMAGAYNFNGGPSTERRINDGQIGSTNKAVGNSEIGEDNRREFRNLDETTSQGGCGDNAIDGSSENLGNSSNSRFQIWQGESNARLQRIGSDGRKNKQWQTQPPLGGTPNGIAGGMDYAELCVSCDNRTDELRLLGNGVVPATAEKAFRTLMEKLL